MNSESEWWESFFVESYLEIIQHIRTDEENRAEAEKIEKLLQLPPGASVLDVPCGNGRHSIELADRGHDVTGVDFAQAHVEDAHRRAAERGLVVRWERRDMRDLPWEKEFDGAFCAGGSFGYFDDEGNRAFLSAVSRTLKPGARFLLDTHNVETILPRFRENFWQRFGDIFSLQENRYDHASSRLHGARTLIKGEKVIKTTSSIRMYTYHELCQLLEEVGFVSCEGYGSLDREPFQLGSRRLFMVAMKEGA